MRFKSIGGRKAGRPVTGPTSSDPIELAMETESADASPDSPAQSLLKKQGHLIDEQLRLTRFQVFNERASGALRVLTGAAGVTIAAILAAMAWSAAHDRTVVFDAFSVPPELVERGVTGEVVASRFLDHIKAIHNASEGQRPDQTFRDNWSAEPTVAIPGAGVSVADIRGVLRAWLGHETHFGGEVIRTERGFLVTARTEAVAARTVEGPAAELDNTLRSAAEALYREAEPFRFGSYLFRQGRRAEATAVLEPLARRGPIGERPWAWSILTILYSLEGDQRKSLAAAQAILRADPDFVLGHAFTANTAYYIGLSELELASYRAAANARRSAGMTAEAFRMRRLSTESEIAGLTGDFESALARTEEQLLINGDNAFEASAAAIAAAKLHDVGTARAWARRSGAASDTARLIHATDGEVHPVDYEIAVALDDWVAARDVMRATIAGSEPGGFWDDVRQVHLGPRLAIALAHTGDIEGARAQLAASASDCYPCLVARGEVETLAGRHTQADQWFGRAVQQAPSLPEAFYGWGRAKLQRGDHIGAIRLLREAHRMGPRWADPLKLWGDALALQGDQRGAIGRYLAASERAPRWGALHLAWGRALAGLGDLQDAQLKYAEASRLGLSPADRDDLRKRMAVRAR